MRACDKITAVNPADKKQFPALIACVLDLAIHWNSICVVTHRHPDGIMQSGATTPKEYEESFPEDRRHAIREMRKVIRKNLPKGFSEAMMYGMLGYVIPHSIYPDGYHVDPKRRYFLWP